MSSAYSLSSQPGIPSGTDAFEALMEANCFSTSPAEMVYLSRTQQSTPVWKVSLGGRGWKSAVTSWKKVFIWLAGPWTSPSQTALARPCRFLPLLMPTSYFTTFHHWWVLLLPSALICCWLYMCWESFAGKIDLVCVEPIQCHVVTLECSLTLPIRS